MRVVIARSGTDWRWECGIGIGIGILLKLLMMVLVKRETRLTTNNVLVMEERRGEERRKWRGTLAFFYCN
jgi:hypothetical protein